MAALDDALAKLVASTGAAQSTKDFARAATNEINLLKAKVAKLEKQPTLPGATSP